MRGPAPLTDPRSSEEACARSNARAGCARPADPAPLTHADEIQRAARDGLEGLRLARAHQQLVVALPARDRGRAGARALDAPGRDPRPRAADPGARVRALHRRQGLRHAGREVLRRLPPGGGAQAARRDRVRHRPHPAGRLLQDHRHEPRGAGLRGAGRRAARGRARGAHREHVHGRRARGGAEARQGARQQAHRLDRGARRPRHPRVAWPAGAARGAPRRAAEPRGARRPGVLEEAGVAAQRGDLRRSVHELRRRGRDPLRLPARAGHDHAEPHARPRRAGLAGRLDRSRGRRHAGERQRRRLRGVGRRPGLLRGEREHPGDARLAARRRARRLDRHRRGDARGAPRGAGQRLPRRARRPRHRPAAALGGGVARGGGHVRPSARPLRGLLHARLGRDQRDRRRGRRGAGRHHRREPGRGARGLLPDPARLPLGQPGHHQPAAPAALRRRAHPLQHGGEAEGPAHRPQGARALRRRGCDAARPALPLPDVQRPAADLRVALRRGGYRRPLRDRGTWTSLRPGA